MKHFTDFLKYRTHKTKKMGQIAKAMLFDIDCKEREIKNLKANLKELEQDISKELIPFYDVTETDYTTDLIESITKSRNWNNEPIIYHNPKKKK